MRAIIALKSDADVRKNDGSSRYAIWSTVAGVGGTSHPATVRHLPEGRQPFPYCGPDFGRWFVFPNEDRKSGYAGVVVYLSFPLIFWRAVGPQQ
jgi:hypothetical protein